MSPCPRCNSLHRADEACPSCGHKTVAAALALAALTACIGQESEPVPAYGVAETGWSQDQDGDGFTASEGDCDDANAAVYPGATETVGDMVDSNCDGADDT